MQRPRETRTLGAVFARRANSAPSQRPHPAGGSASAAPRPPDAGADAEASADRAAWLPVPLPSAPLPSAASAGDFARPLIVPATQRLPAHTAPVAARATARLPRWFRPIMLVAAVATLAVAVTLGARGTLAPATASGTPPPSGRGPFSASAGIAAIATVAPPKPTLQSSLQAPAPQSTWAALQPCQQSQQFLPVMSQWAVPPGCYATIYVPNPANYVNRPGFGFCNWWVRVTHPNHPDITENTAYPRGTTPEAGAPIFFDGGEQGAESIGHWAMAVAVAPDHYWVLISEMNFAWRGAGFGRIDYRYIHVSPHVHFVYIYS